MELANNLFSDIETDGMKVNTTSEPSDKRCVYITPGQKEREDYRITTFNKFPSNVPVDKMKLSSNGFLYTGFKDRVKCFRCGQCVEGLNGTEDMSLPGWHKPDCELAKGTDTTNVPLFRHKIQQNLPGLQNASFVQTIPNRDQSTLSAGELLQFGNIDQTTNQIVTPRNLPVQQTLNQLGPMYQTATIHKPQLQVPYSVLQSTRATEPAPRRPENSQFSCSNPRNAHMRSERVRLQTFMDNLGKWSSYGIVTTPEQMADAGLFYLGDRDRTKCWYCNGGLQNWEPNDDPWYEHAKWFPECEFVLQQKGERYVHRIARQFPNLNRPRISNPYQMFGRSNNDVPPPQPQPQSPGPVIIDPQEEQRKLKSKIDEEMKSSAVVEGAKQMGFEEKEIKRAITQNMKKTGESFSTLLSLVDAILADNGDDDTSSEEQSETSTAPETTLTFNTDQQSTASELQRLEMARFCKICRQKEAAVVLLPCGHLSCCDTCGKEITKCPICKLAVTDKVHSFIA
ncbi:baculoviral IAP repeat-containing protein 7-A [Ciona intestinalis]